MQRLLFLIWAIIKIYIINPILRIWNYYINHSYIPNNQRNIDIYDFLTHVVDDNNYQASTPVENYIENVIKQDFITVQKENPEEGHNDIEALWQEKRPLIYADIANGMLELMWIDDED